MHAAGCASAKAALIALLALELCCGALAQQTTITIQADQPGKPISPDLFGVFFEDLNYAADGGLYAELIQNRSFEYSPVEQSAWNPLSFWELQKRGGGDGSVGVSNMRPIHENNPHYAILTVRTPGLLFPANKERLGCFIARFKFAHFCCVFPATGADSPRDR